MSFNHYSQTLHEAALPRWDAVLGLWATGLSARLIAEQTGVPRNSVCRIAREARSRGDARAVARGAPANMPTKAARQ